VKADAEDRTKRLLEGVLAVSSGMDLEVTLRRVVQAAVDLVDARYGALGMLGGAGGTDRFVSVGIDDGAGALIGSPPTIILTANSGPTARGSRCVPPAPGSRPSFTSGRPSFASFVATRKWQASATSRPPPSAVP